MNSKEKEGLKLAIQPGDFGACRLHPKARIPRWVHRSDFFNITRTGDELSIICEQQHVPGGVRCERDWRLIKVLGTLDFSLIGVLASMAQPLAEARIGLLTVSTYDTDYLMVRASKLDDAVKALEGAGHRFETESSEDPADSEAQDVESAAADDDSAPAQSEPTPEAAAPPEIASPEATSPEKAEASDETDDEEESAPEPRRRTRTRSRSRTRRSRRAETAAEERSDEAAAPAEAPEAADEAPHVADVIAAGIGDYGIGDEPARGRRTGSLYLEDDWEHVDDVAPADPSSDVAPADSDEAQEEASAPADEPSQVEEMADSSDAPEAEDAESNLPLAVVLPTDPLPADELPADELPADERVSAEDEGDDASGLYTGAIPQNPVETTEDNFESLGLSSRMVATLDEIGFIHPTPIQAAVLPMALEGSDIVGLAETGSGKTGAFGLPLAERLHHGRGVRGLILCPTREIALQTKAFLDIFGRDHELETAVVIGGVKFQPQINALRRHPDIVVATPGRLADHMRRGNVRLDKIEELVLDEADHMLDLGFLPQIQEIVSRVPHNRRTMMFSATMPPTIERLAQRFLNDPYLVDLRPVNRVAAGIEHRLYLVESGDERKCLTALLEEVEDTTLVFARRKLDTEFLARQLQLAGLPAERIHSDRTQAQRVRALRGFREGKNRILVATDVAARGIDVPHLGHVINFGMPDSVEDYVHRAGRTARGKAVGIVSSIGTWQDKPMVKEIERAVGQPIKRSEVEGVKPYREMTPKRGRRRRRLL